jgi:hypothetical protein
MLFGFLQIDLCVYFEYKTIHFTTKFFSAITHLWIHDDFYICQNQRCIRQLQKEHNIDNICTLIVKSFLKLRMKDETLKGLMQKCL